MHQLSCIDIQPDCVWLLKKKTFVKKYKIIEKFEILLSNKFAIGA